VLLFVCLAVSTVCCCFIHFSINDILAWLFKFSAEYSREKYITHYQIFVEIDANT